MHSGWKSHLTTFASEASHIYFLAHWSIIFDLFYAVKTMLSKLENLPYLRSKKVNFNAQHWLHRIKKVKNNRSMAEEINVSYFARKIVEWDFSSDFQMIPRTMMDAR